jgi:mannose-1-phosphate guanylyltransferase
MVLAAGLGTRLRPITYEVPKPMVPVANRPVLEHLLRLLRRYDLGEIIANLHWFPETIRGPLGDGSALGVDLTYIDEAELTGTAGGVRAARDFLTSDGDSFVVLAGDALTDAGLKGLIDAHGRNGGVATLGVKQVANVSEYGVIITDPDGRVQGFQEKPEPAEALSDLVNCMIYAFSPEIFDYFPEETFVDFANDVFPALLDNDVPFHVHRIERYWNDVGSIGEYVRGNLDAVEGHVEVDLGGEVVEADADPESPGGGGLDAPAAGLPAGTEVNGRVLVGDGAEVSEGVRFDGSVVIGDGARIGPGAMVKESVLLPGAEIPAGALVVGGIAGRKGAVARERGASAREW